MKFRINSEEFSKALCPAINIATMHANKYFVNSGLVCLKIISNQVIVTAHGGTAAIEVPVCSHTYKCIEEGFVTVNAKDFEQCINSFPAGEDVILCVKDDILMISKASNEDEYTCISIIDGDIVFPAVAKKFQKRLKINRPIFSEGLKIVKFAMGKFETQSYYMCTRLEASKSQVRFVAGTGARFAVKDFKGKNITNVSKPVSVILPRYNIPNLIAILAKSDCADITIKEAAETPTTPAQIIIEFDNIKVMLLGVDPSINYPDANMILNLGYPCRVSVDINDWKEASKAIKSASTQKIKRERDYNIVKIAADPGQSHLVLEANTDVKAVRTVPYALDPAGDDVNTADTDRRWFCVNSIYLEEMASKAGKAKEMTIKFEGIRTTSDDSEAKTKPVLVSYPETLHKSGAKEKFHLFFVCAKVDNQ